MIAWELGDEVSDATFGFDVFPKFVTTQDIHDYLNTVNNRIAAVQRDIQTNTGIIADDLKKNWSDYVDRWRPFYDKEKDTSHFWFIESTMQTIDTFNTELSDYQSKVNASLANNKIVPSAPSSAINPSDTGKTGAQTTVDVIKAGTIAAAVVIGGVLLFKAAEYLPKPRKTVQ
jgi:hypothetical protein